MKHATIQHKKVQVRKEKGDKTISMKIKFLVLFFILFQCELLFCQHREREDIFIDMEFEIAETNGLKFTVEYSKWALSYEFSNSSESADYENFNSLIKTKTNCLNVAYFPFGNFNERVAGKSKMKWKRKDSNRFLSCVNFNKKPENNLILKGIRGLYGEIGYGIKNQNYIATIHESLGLDTEPFLSDVTYKGVNVCAGTKIRIWRFIVGASYQAYFASPKINDPNDFLNRGLLIDGSKPLDYKIFHGLNLSAGINIAIK